MAKELEKLRVEIDALDKKIQSLIVLLSVRNKRCWNYEKIIDITRRREC